MDSGGRCAMTPGIWLMLRWCVDSSAAAGSCRHRLKHVLDRAAGPSGWTTLRAQAESQSSVNADTKALDPTTVVTMRMLVSSVKVGIDKVPRVVNGANMV